MRIVFRFLLFSFVPYFIINLVLLCKQSRGNRFFFSFYLFGLGIFWEQDIRQRVPGNLRPLMTNIPASSMYSVRLGPTQSRPVSVSESPHATSSNASSEMSVNNNALCFNGSQVDDDINSEKVDRSPAGVLGR